MYLRRFADLIILHTFVLILKHAFEQFSPLPKNMYERKPIIFRNRERELNLSNMG